MGLPPAAGAVRVSDSVPRPPFSRYAVNVDGLDVPLTRHGAVYPLLYVIVLAAGIAPHATVVFAGAVITGNAAGFTVIVLDTDAITLPHAYVAVDVSSTVPSHSVGVVEFNDGLDVPLIRHGAVNPLL